MELENTLTSRGQTYERENTEDNNPLTTAL